MSNLKWSFAGERSHQGTESNVWFLRLASYMSLNNPCTDWHTPHIECDISFTVFSNWQFNALETGFTGTYSATQQNLHPVRRAHQCLESGRSPGVINNRKIQTFSANGGRLREVVSYERLQLQWFDWERFGKVVANRRWLLTRGGPTGRFDCSLVSVRSRSTRPQHSSNTASVHAIFVFISLLCFVS